MHFPATSERSSFSRLTTVDFGEDETEVDLSLEDAAAAGLPNYAALILSSGRTLEIHGLGILAASVKTPSHATEPSFILRNPDGSIEDSGALNVGER